MIFFPLNNEFFFCLIKFNKKKSWFNRKKIHNLTKKKHNSTKKKLLTCWSSRVRLPWPRTRHTAPPPSHRTPPCPRSPRPHTLPPCCWNCPGHLRDLLIQNCINSCKHKQLFYYKMYKRDHKNQALDRFRMVGSNHFCIHFLLLNKYSLLLFHNLIIFLIVE